MAAIDVMLLLVIACVPEITLKAAENLSGHRIPLFESRLFLQRADVVLSGHENFLN